MRQGTHATLMCLIWAVAACSPNADNDPSTNMEVAIENSGAGESVANTASEAADESATNADRSASTDAAATTMIPPAIQGRWALTSADCTTTHGDAKGLLEISATALTFYESRGKLATLTERESTRIVGQFAFSGEGMSWEREMMLQVQDSGNTLIRRDRGKDAEPGPYRYTRCAA